MKSYKQIILLLRTQNACTIFFSWKNLTIFTIKKNVVYIKKYLTRKESGRDKTDFENFLVVVSSRWRSLFEPDKIETILLCLSNINAPIEERWTAFGPARNYRNFQSNFVKVEESWVVRKFLVLTKVDKNCLGLMSIGLFELFDERELSVCISVVCGFLMVNYDW